MTSFMSTDLQRLFKEAIVRQSLFPEVHPGQASYVWLVETKAKRCIVRTTRLSNVPPSEFWWGCKALFGVVSDDVHAMAQINETLRSTSLLPIPRVLATDRIDEMPFVVVEELPGKTVRSFSQLSERACQKLGRGIASIHRLHKPSFGNFALTTHRAVAEFPKTAASVAEDLIHRFYSDKPEFSAVLPESIDSIARMAAPSYAVPILLDMDPSQFLAEDEEITGLVDTELYAWGPPEWDLAALEYLLDEQRAFAFRQGYESVSQMPALEKVRKPYRFLQRLMELQGAVPLEQWMNQPVWFD